MFYRSNFLNILAGAVTPATTAFDFISFLGPFHAVLLHFPFGFIAVACLLELYYWRKPQLALRKVMYWLLPLSAISLLGAAILGLCLAGRSNYGPALTIDHRNYGLLVTSIAVLATCALRIEKRSKSTLWTLIFRILLVMSCVALVCTGHSGGKLTHGKNFLSKNAPSFFRKFIYNPVSENSFQSNNLLDTNKIKVVFEMKVEPILRKHCLKCHGPEKQKGDYRVDDMRILFAGGESEVKAIIPGNPGDIKLIQGILLPEDDDDVMPPGGKERLSDDEALTLIKWIQKGAHIIKAKR